MKAATIRTFQTVHTWAGLLAGFALFVAFYAGALTVFHDDIAAWQNPPWRAAADANVPMDTLIERLLAHHPEARQDFGIVLARDSSHAVKRAPCSNGRVSHASTDTRRPRSAAT